MVFIIFPTQLFYNLNHLDKNELILLIEEPRYFTDFDFHKLKLAYHRATMKKYYNMLIKNGYGVKYIEYNKVSDNFYIKLKNVKYIDPNDFKLEKKLKKLIKDYTKLENINFLIKSTELDTIKKNIYKNNKYSHSAFYKYQRIKLNILIDEHNNPINNKWSFDTENRLPLPDNYKINKLNKKNKINNFNKYIIEAIEYINKHFPNNYGSLDNFIYPIDNKGSKLWLNKFLKERLKLFGKYQDAVSQDDHFINHSVLSPMMNIGILTDTEVITISYSYYLKHKRQITIQSFEGFIRQVIGWRNYMLAIYKLEGESMRKNNLLNHKNKINHNFWLGTTGIEPIDNIIKNIVKYSYAHHIERLMYLGNFMLLCLIDPTQVYNIFMEWTIDAYDWVMVPNVYGMSQYACGNKITTRPYFSSSNYIHRMSNYKKDNWSTIWDALYYNFINKHQKLLKKNYAIAQQVNNWNRKDKKQQNELIDIANQYLDIITKK
jgi:deoxyribodipyrimidine photolyase-related protein